MSQHSLTGRDPTASHYLKVILDAIFGAKNFQNEITWKRFSGKNDPSRYGRSHDVIFFYTKSLEFTWNKQYGPFEPDYVETNYRFVEPETGRRYRHGDLTAAKPGGDVDYEWHGAKPYKGRHWAYSRVHMDEMLAAGRIDFRKTGMPVFRRYLDEQPGVPLQDVWTDIRLHAGSLERLHYQTQKPLALLERIIKASTNEGDVVLDPFCGCGTTVDAAQKLERRWIGIDITTLAVDLIDARLRFTYGEQITETYEVLGIPQDVGGAQRLFERSPFEFERWCVMMLDGQPNEKQVGDKGSDGEIKIFTGAKRDSDRVIISVKGGSTSPGHVRDLLGTLGSRRAAMGVFVCMRTPTKDMRELANTSGAYMHPGDGREYPRLQIITVQEIIDGKRPKLPPTLSPYFQARKRDAPDTQLTLDV